MVNYQKDRKNSRHNLISITSTIGSENLFQESHNPFVKARLNLQYLRDALNLRRKDHL